jgi:acetoin utilization deacetylase AcuC-like enzyme
MPHTTSSPVHKPKLAVIPVFYSPQMAADNDSFSPSAAKPRAAVESWLKLGVPVDVVAPEPATVEDLVRAHRPAFVDGVLSCRIENGFYNRSEAVAKSLPYTSGAMLAAAREAIRNGRVAAAPCSGFHHAGYDRAGGFCTFNGLMVTALALYASGKASRVGILDFDQHYGDGTDNIIDRLRIDWISHYSAGEHYGFATDARRFLSSIPGLVGAMRDCDVILYQAGADPHIDDPLGGWLTTEQLYERDLLVFEAAAALGVPVAWNLAGGYQTPLRKVLRIHDGTIRACAAAHLGYVPP